MTARGTLQFLIPSTVALRLDESGGLTGAIEDEEYAHVRARALFPFSLPGDYVELRDDEGSLVGFIKHLDDLRPESADAIRASMRLRHFVPLVKQILSISGRHHMFTWKVTTDRGEAEFHIRGRRQNMEEIGGGEYLVTDAEGNRYRIPNVAALDARSLMHLRKVL